VEQTMKIKLLLEKESYEDDEPVFEQIENKQSFYISYENV
jgi:hypothetical protein